jgi:hypothetical protein
MRNSLKLDGKTPCTFTIRIHTGADQMCRLGSSEGNFSLEELIAKGERLPFLFCRPRGPQALEVDPDNVYEVV